MYNISTKLHAQDLSLDLMLEEPGCVEVFLHPLLKVLEVTQENVSAVLETSHNITGRERERSSILTSKSTQYSK